MRGVVVGCSVKKCGPDKKWDSACTLSLQVEKPDSPVCFGNFYKTYTFEGRLLPCQPKDIIGKDVSISMNNNFVEDVILRG